VVLHLTARRSTRWILAGDLLIAAGLGAVLYFVWFEWDGASYQHLQRAEFLRNVADTREAHAGAKQSAVITTAPFKRTASVAVTRTSRDIRAFAQLRIPSVKLDVIVGEGVDDDTLRLAVGHLGSSALPGQTGNLVLFGHRDTFFHPLHELRAGDVAEVTATSGLFRYRIDDIKVVGHNDLDVSQPKDRVAITLITCFPFNYIGPSPRGYVAQGLLIGTN